MSGETVGSRKGELDICRKTEDLIELNPTHGLWLKPISKINIAVALPSTKQSGQCIGTLAVSEKLKKRIRPHSFKNLKVLKSTLDLMRFEADLDSKSIMETVITKLDRTSLKLNGFIEELKIKAAKVKLKSSRHDWETFFRDDFSMDEMKPGLRADTIHLTNLPTKWFGGDKPKPKILLDVFQVFGDIRRYHIPCLDNVQSTVDGTEKDSEATGFKRFNFTEVLTFDAFIMYRDYIGFVKAMDGLMGKKLVKKLDQIEKYLEFEFQVDFDKSKHLSDKSIKKRTLLRRYGLKDIKELKDFKEHAKKEKQKYNERFKLLKDRKKKAQELLKVLLNEVSNQVEAQRKEEEAKREVERLAKKAAAEAEAKEREAIEKANEMKRKHSSSSGGPGLKSIAISLTKESTSAQRVSIKSIAVPLNRDGHSDRNHYHDDRHSRHYPQHHNHYHSTHQNHHPNNHKLPHHYHHDQPNNLTFNSRFNSHNNYTTTNHTNKPFLQSTYHRPQHDDQPRSSPRITARIDLPDHRDSGVRNVQRKLRRDRKLVVQVTWQNNDNEDS